MTYEAELQWCRNMFEMMKDGGTWIVPRSGLIFKKVGGSLILQTTVAVAPELGDYQDADFDLIRRRFDVAGIKVMRGGQG